MRWSRMRNMEEMEGMKFGMYIEEGEPNSVFQVSCTLYILK